MKYAGQAKFQRYVSDLFSDGAEVYCEYCGALLSKSGINGVKATADHRIPLCRGGTSTFDNLAVCCHTCNRRKGPLTDSEFREVMGDKDALQRKLSLVNYELGLTAAAYRSPIERTATKRAKRLLALADRVQDPDPNCPSCNGTGWKPGRNLVLCPCSLSDITGWS